MMGSNYAFPDELTFAEAARALLGGEDSGDLRHNSPAYPFLLASFWIFLPQDIFTLRVLQAGITSLGSILTYQLPARAASFWPLAGCSGFSDLRARPAAGNFFRSHLCRSPHRSPLARGAGPYTANTGRSGYLAVHSRGLRSWIVHTASASRRRCGSRFAPLAGFHGKWYSRPNEKSVCRRPRLYSHCHSLGLSQLQVKRAGQYESGVASGNETSTIGP